MEIITAGSVTAIIGVLIWYLKYTTKQQAIHNEKHDAEQAKDRDFNRNLITCTLKEIHTNGLKNAELNRKSINLQKKFANESVITLKNISDRLNGGTRGMNAIKTLKAIDERKKDSKVKVDRRK